MIPLVYAEGQCYEEFKNVTDNGPMFDMLDIGHGLLMIYKESPSDSDVEEFAQMSAVEFGLLYYHKQIVITFHIDKAEYMDMPYNPYLTSVASMDELRHYPDPEYGLIITVLLIDSSNGEIKKKHIINAGKEFHKELAKDIRDKMSLRYSPEKDMRDLQSLCLLYPNPIKLARAVDFKVKIPLAHETSTNS